MSTSQGGITVSTVDAKEVFATVDTSQMRVDKAALLVKLEENKKKHIEEYKDALAGYWTLVEQQLAECKSNIAKELRSAKAGVAARDKGFTKAFRASITAIPPTDYSRNYSRAITSLSWQSEPRVMLSQSEFNRYVLDDWDWKAEHMTTLSSLSFEKYGPSGY